MGTRHLTAVIYKEEVKVAQYGQWDGYPEGQGKNIIQFLLESNLEKFKEQLSKVSFFTAEEIDKENRMGSPFERRPYLSRDTGSNILQLIYKGEVDKLINSIDFAADSLFCEWAYVLDLDKNVLEVYKGFNKEKLNENERFFYLTEKAEGEYAPIKLFVSFDLNPVPLYNEFIKRIEEKFEEIKNNTKNTKTYDVVLLSTQEGDWEGLYVNGNLVSEGHEIQPLEMLKLAEKHSFKKSQLISCELNDKDDEAISNRGSLPKKLKELEGIYNVVEIKEE